MNRRMMKNIIKDIGEGITLMILVIFSLWQAQLSI